MRTNSKSRDLLHWLSTTMSSPKICVVGFGGMLCIHFANPINTRIRRTSSGHSLFIPTRESGGPGHSCLPLELCLDARQGVRTELGSGPNIYSQNTALTSNRKSLEFILDGARIEVRFNLLSKCRLTWHGSRGLCRKRGPCRRQLRLYCLYLQVSPTIETRLHYLQNAHRCLPDVQTTPQILGPLLARSHNFVLIQNGIGIELDLQKVVPGAVVMSGCAWIDATIVDHGRTLKHGPLVSKTNQLQLCMRIMRLTQERLVVGAHPPLGTSPKAPQSTEAHTALTAFVNFLKNGGGTLEQAHNIDAARWKKIIWYETHLSSECKSSWFNPAIFVFKERRLFNFCHSGQRHPTRYMPRAS
jgi:hypothetical protein